MSGKSVIAERSFTFALKIIALYKALVAEREYVLSKQLLRSGTSIGANVSEAAAAQSRKDFISKMAIASKEARETTYWLALLAQSELTTIDVSQVASECEQLCRILTSIVKTTSESP